MNRVSLLLSVPSLALLYYLRGYNSVRNPLKGTRISLPRLCTRRTQDIYHVQPVPGVLSSPRKYAIYLIPQWELNLIMEEHKKYTLVRQSKSSGLPHSFFLLYLARVIIIECGNRAWKCNNFYCSFPSKMAVNRLGIIG